MNDESAPARALPNYRQPDRRPLAGRAVAHLANGNTYSGWVEIGRGVVTIDGRLRTTAGPSHCGAYEYRRPTRRTYPVRALKRIDWAEPGQ
jgi:hypothetical protein